MSKSVTVDLPLGPHDASKTNSGYFKLATVDPDRYINFFMMKPRDHRNAEVYGEERCISAQEAINLRNALLLIYPLDKHPPVTRLIVEIPSGNINTFTKVLTEDFRGKVVAK